MRYTEAIQQTQRWGSGAGGTGGMELEELNPEPAALHEDKTMCPR